MLPQIKRMILKEAVSLINDGDAIVLGGWTIMRTPMGAAYELVRQNKKNLYISASATGTITDFLIGAGTIKICEASWHGHELYGPPYNFSRVMQENDGSFRHCEETTSSVFLRTYAAAMGLPFLPTLSLKGSDILNPDYDTLADLRGKDPKLPKKRFVEIDDPFWDGRKVILLPASRPDVCILHVQEVGEEGTVRISGPQYGDMLFAAAAKLTIVTAERIVSEKYLKDNPRLNSIPGEFVDVIVELPYGSHPGGCYGYYDTDPWFYQKYLDASKSKEKFQNWLNEWVLTIDSHESYIEMLGTERLEAIKADEDLGYNPRLDRAKKGMGRQQ